MKNKKVKWLCAAMVLANVVSMPVYAAGTEIQTSGGVATVSESQEEIGRAHV